jgi:hypothetical protein
MLTGNGPGHYTESLELIHRRPLTAEEARKSLIQLVERPDEGVAHSDFLEKLLPRLNSDRIEQINAEEIAVGPWRCDLRKATWNVSLEFPNALRHQLNEWHGVFQRSPDGRWVARTTGSCSAD